MIRYRVTRKCCTSGNCVTCTRTPGHKFGTPVRVEHITLDDRNRAETVAKSWGSHDGKVEEVQE